MIIKNEHKGRCVISEKDYKKGDIVEYCQYIKIPGKEINILKKTVLNDYWFGIDGYAMIILGNGSLYNHSTNPNIIPTIDEEGNFGFVAMKDIEYGDELVFDYGYKPKFEVIYNLKLIKKDESKATSIKK